jgi:hypothetical protein
MISKIKKIGFINFIDDLLNNKLSYINFRIHKLLGKAYFGSYLASSQGQKIRHKFMQAIIYEKFKNYDDEIHLIEIGSWAGGSVLTWIEILESMNKKYKIFCIDPWQDYLKEEKSLWTHKTMRNALKQNKIYELFLHNIISSGHSQNVSILRGTTFEISTILKENSFDVIFIDGNHSYEFVKIDLQLTSKLLKNDGLLCGDDLELQYHEVNQEQLNKNKNKDIIVDSYSGKNYHPGVSLAIHDFFDKQVQSINGFWFIEKNNEQWNDMNIKDINFDSINIPKHLERNIL